MDAELVKALSYAQMLGDAAIGVVAVAPEYVELNQNWAQDPKIVGLTILCRSITNFRAAVLLVQQEHPHMVAKALVRMLYENLVWLGALKERGFEFVQDLGNTSPSTSARLANLQGAARQLPTAAVLEPITDRPPSTRSCHSFVYSMTSSARARIAGARSGRAPRRS